MSEKSRPCPKCDGVMYFRLGEFQCASCDHTEPLDKPQDTDTPTGRRSWVWDAVTKRSGSRLHQGISAPDDWTRQSRH